MADALPPPRELADSGVVITGGTSGIGLAGARAFVVAGVRRVVLIGRNEARGAAACDRVRELAADARVEFVSADANDAGGARRAGERARELIGSIDVLVNSTAGSYMPKLLHEQALEDVREALIQQAMAPLLMTRVVLPWMREQRRGCIINIASDAAKVATPGESVIGAAMGAILAFSRAVAMEAKRDGIRVNVLTPSLVEGTATAEKIFADPFSARLFTADQAALLVFLASPQAARLTGQAISANGGISAA
jgi:NAD(P)-dependent dehydrogenase (short-subunit alcohol dehydrogenase family)